MSYYTGKPNLHIRTIPVSLPGCRSQIMLPSNRFVTFSRKPVSASVILIGRA